MSREAPGLIGGVLTRTISPVRHQGEAGRPWWRRPGIGVQYQIEYRPGLDWERDYRQFNHSMMDDDGNLAFNGPFCNVEDWVELSAQTGADYHMMEIKWHDGFCYFDTGLTDWKTPDDYAARFAAASRKAGIPFMFYYSSIFDHNPMFDSIQPTPGHTISFIGYKAQYLDYIRAQYREIMEKYAPDGMWMDWYWPDEATDTTIDLFRSEYPGTVLAFNASNYFPSAHRRLHYTSGEAHNLDGRYLKLVKMERGVVPVFASCWKWATLGRRLFEPPWELIAPAGRWWQDPTLRDDPNDLLRMAAIVMANGGLFFMGVTSKLDGSIYADQVTQLGILGDWYIPRKQLFAESVPARYRRREPQGVVVRPAGFKTTACEQGPDTLLHLFNMRRSTGPAAGAYYQADVSVTTLNGTSNASTFYVAPYINTCSPTWGNAGVTIVTLSGSGFGPSRGTNSVWFDSSKASTYSSWSNTGINVQVGAGANGQSHVKAMVFGCYSNAKAFDVRPVINSISPTSGAAGSTITISGSAFCNSQGTGCVYFGSVAATSYVSWKQTQVKVNVPAGISGTVQVKVYTLGGMSNYKNFTKI